MIHEQKTFPLKPNRTGAYLGLAAALLFGASTPLAKALLQEVDPGLLAGLLYLGAGIGLGALGLVRRMSGQVTNEGSLTKRDVPWLAGAVLAGGVVGPVLLMVGLQKTSAANASLMLNSEAVLTAVLAWTLFKENFDRRILLGMIAIVAGAIVLSWAGRPEGTSGIGELLIALACLAWAIDNNVTRNISGADPQLIAGVKGLAAGLINCGIALAMGAEFPSAWYLLGAGVVGFLGYGLSLQLYVLALRHVGTARTGAYFSVAPFAGALVSFAMFSSSLTAAYAVAAGLMAIGVWLHLSELHDHEHTHDEMWHDHKHVHDEHHQHEHPEDVDPTKPHSHLHHHTVLAHKHPHYPDLHHRHSH